MSNFLIDARFLLRRTTETFWGAPLIVAGGKNFMTPGRSLNCSSFDLNDLYFTLGGLLGMGLTSFYPIKQSNHPYGSDTGRMSGSSLIPL